MIQENLSTIHIVQNLDRFPWLGVPLFKRYSQSIHAPKEVLKAMNRIDPLLDLKVYLPTMRWHVVRYPKGYLAGEVTRVCELKDDPERGLRNEPGLWLVDWLQARDTQGANEDFMKRIEEAEALHEKRKEAEMNDLAMEMAKDMRKPLLKYFDDGPQSDFTGVWQCKEELTQNSDVPSVEKEDDPKTS